MSELNSPNSCNTEQVFLAWDTLTTSWQSECNEMCLQVAVEYDAMTSFLIRILDINPQLSMDLWVVGTVNKRHDTPSPVKTLDSTG